MTFLSSLSVAFFAFSLSSASFILFLLHHLLDHGHNIVVRIASQIGGAARTDAGASPASRAERLPPARHRAFFLESPCAVRAGLHTQAAAGTAPLINQGYDSRG